MHEHHLSLDKLTWFRLVVSVLFFGLGPVDTFGDAAAALITTVNAIRLALASFRPTIALAFALVLLA